MTTLPERLLALHKVIGGLSTGLTGNTVLLSARQAAEIHATLSEAAQALQAQEVVKETTINHARDPHCCGCYVIRWNDGDPVAVCGECGVQVALLDRLVAPEGWVLVPKWLLEQAYGMAREGCEAPMAAYRWCERIDSIFHGAESEYEYADFAQPLPPTFPSQSAALQAGEV